ncbi:MAG: hypothetical protein V4565_06920 [Bacteroidota bacterium]
MIKGYFKSAIKKTNYLLLFIVFVISYFFIYGFYGYSDGDDGYVLAFSWRVFQGEIPYRDFISVRPPLTFLFHALPLYIIPDNYQIIFERFLFYVLMALSSLFCSLSLTNVFKQNFHINPYLMATVGFVFSVHNFLPMPWYTVDGIFFASLGIFLLVRFSSLYSIVFGMLFLFFSALCKQPFYLMPFAGIAFIILVYRDWKKTIVAIFCLIILMCIFLYILYYLKALKGFLSLTTGSTKLNDLLAAGVFSYLRVYSLYIIITIGFWIIAQRLSDMKKFSRITELVPYFFISFLLFYPLAHFGYSVLYKGIVYDPVHSFGYEGILASFLFILSVFLFILKFKIEKSWISLFFLTLLSWCSSISWGIQSPVLFSTPLLFSFFLISNKYFNIKNITQLVKYTLSIGTFTYYVAYQKPSCNPIRRDLVYEISDIFPKLNHIKVGKDIYNKYHEFKSLTNKYGSNFKTLPGMPLSNYLTNTKSPISLDWVSNGETNNHNEDVLKTLVQQNVVVFVEKKPQLITVLNTKDRFNSSVTYHIKSNWIKIDSTQYFEIYKNK